MSDESEAVEAAENEGAPPVTDPEPAVAVKTVVLATERHSTFSLGAGHPVVEHSGTTVTADQADQIRTAARKMGVRITVKEA